MTSPVKRRILANLKPGMDVLVTRDGAWMTSGVLREEHGQLVMYPHPFVVRDFYGDSPSLIRSVEVISPEV